MMSSNSDKWRKIRTVEEALALLADVNTERVLIKRRCLEFGDEQSYLAAERQKRALERLQITLSLRWHEMMEKEQ